MIILRGPTQNFASILSALMTRVESTSWSTEICYERATSKNIMKHTVLITFRITNIYTTYKAILTSILRDGLFYGMYAY